MCPLFATGGKLVPNWWQNLPPVAGTGGKFAAGVVDTGGAPLLTNISANF
jgi:hypothetical protein